MDSFHVHTNSADPWYVVGYDVARLGASAELHVFPSFVVDPWCGMEVGAFFGALAVQPSGNAYPDATSPSGVGLDTAGDLGIDVHIGRATVGPFFTLLAPLAHREVMGGGDFLYSNHVSGLPVSLSLRAGAAF